MRALAIVTNDLNYICTALSSECRVIEGKRLLITGGAGFLGYYLINSLLHYNRYYRKNHSIDVTVYDNFVRGIPTWLSPMKTESNFQFRKVDISKNKIPISEHFDFIIHAASIASPTYYRLHPIKTMDTNVNGLRHILEYAVKKKESKMQIPEILYFSSSEIYGDPAPQNIPTDESYFGNVSCIGPRSCYDESKRYGETLCVNFSQQHHIPIKIVRPFNNYGPGLKITDRRVIPDFARSILKNQPVVLLSNGAPSRTFCYVSDAIVGYVKTLIKGRMGEPYNIGVDKPEISMVSLADLMVGIAKNLWNYSGSVKYAVSEDSQYLTHNPQRRCPVITKAKLELGYNPTVSLEEGIKRSLIWYKENQYAENA